MHREQISSVPPARHNRKVVTVRKASAELRGTIPSADDRDTAAEETATTVITVTEENRRTRMKVELKEKSGSMTFSGTVIRSYRIRRNFVSVWMRCF